MWVDVTDDIPYQLSHNTSSFMPKFRCDCGTPLNFRAPFSGLGVSIDIGVNMTVEMLAVVLSAEPNDALRIPVCDGVNSCKVLSKTSLLGDLRELDLKLFQSSNLGPTGIWINSSDHILGVANGPSLDPPDPPFPFSRLAVLSSAISEHS